MYKIRTILPAILLLSCLAVSCELINPPEPIPAYIRIDTISFKVTQFDQGEATHQISNIWINVDNEILGIFEMPFQVPCLKTGEKELFIRPGIRVNGIAASRMVYPFMEPYRVTHNLVPGEVITLLPSTTYKKECKFSWIEEFEDIGISFNYSQYTDVNFTIQSDTVRSGRYSGALYFDTDNNFFEATGPHDFILPKNGVPVIFEFDYTNSVGFMIGAYILEDGAGVWNDLVFVKSNPVWKRFYFDMEPTVRTNPTAEAYRIGIRAEYDSTGAQKQAIIFDNVKLIHF
jgi:hypothetical protein